MQIDSTYLQDLRREPRLPADGTVALSFSHAGHHNITGELMDVSASGFRAAHDFTGMSTGLTVQFRHPSGNGRARVVWNRITGARVESGFFIIS